MTLKLRATTKFSGQSFLYGIGGATEEEVCRVHLKIREVPLFYSVLLMDLFKKTLQDISQELSIMVLCA